jgi:O-antigen ligase
MSFASIHTQPRLPLFRDFSTACAAMLALVFAIKVEGNDSTFHWQIKSLFLLLALVMVVLFRAFRGGLNLPKHPVILWFSAFLGWTALSIIWSAATGESYLQVLVVSSGFLAMLLGFWANDKQWRYFYSLLIPLAWFLILLTAYQAFALHNNRPAGLFLNWNTNSAFLGLILLPRCANYLLRVSQQQTSLWLGLFLAACTFGMTLGQGRGSLLVLALGLGILFFAYRKQTHAMRGILHALSWILGGYILAEIFHGGLLSQRLITTFQAAQQGGNNLDALGSGRQFLWAEGWRMFLDRPLLGWGINIFHWLYPQYRSPLHLEAGQYVHNDYLQFLIELGPIGLLLCLCWVLALFRLGWRLLRSPEQSEQRFLNLGIALACAALLIHSFVDFHLYQPAMLFLLGAYAGRLCQQQASTSGVIIYQLQEKVNAFSYYGLLSVASLILGFDLITLSIGIQAIGDDPRTPIPTLLAQCETAQQFAPLIENIQSCQGWVLLAWLENQPDALPPAKRQQLITYALESLDVATQSNTLNYFNHNTAAKLLQLQAKHDARIAQHLRRSLVLNPYQLDVRLALADFLESDGKPEQAQAVLFAGLNKNYVCNATQVSAFWHKLDRYIDSTPAYAAQKQRVSEEIKFFAGQPASNRDALYIYTLPDLGWKP